jgi:hypothetical protein
MIILIVLFLFNPYFEFQDGAVYAIIPDCPLIEYPINQTMEFMAVIGMAKYIAGHFNIELFTYKHFIVILMCIMFFIFYF